MDGSTSHGTLYPTYSRLPSHYKLLECVLDSLETCSSLKILSANKRYCKSRSQCVYFWDISLCRWERTFYPGLISEQRSKNKCFDVEKWIESLIVRGPWRIMSLTSAGELRVGNLGRRFDIMRWVCTQSKVELTRLPKQLRKWPSFGGLRLIYNELRRSIKLRCPQSRYPVPGPSTPLLLSSCSLISYCFYCVLFQYS